MVEFWGWPGFLDDCFRSSLWVKVQSTAQESLGNLNDVPGDLALISVTEGEAALGAGWRRDISSLSLSTDEYPLAWVRFKGGGASPEFRFKVGLGGGEEDSGWVEAPQGFTAMGLELAPGETVEWVEVYARSAQPHGSAQVYLDYISILAAPPVEARELEKVEVDLACNTGVSQATLEMVWDPLLGSTLRWYRLDEGWGGRAYDLGPSREASRFVGATWVPGVAGHGLGFDSSQLGRLDTGLLISVPGDGCLTLSMWVKAQPGAQGVLAGSGQATPQGWNRLQLNWSGDKVRIYARDDQGQVLQAVTQAVVADGGWHHLVGEVDPGRGEVRLHVDGVLDAWAQGSLGDLTISNHDLTVGCLHNEAGYSNHTSMEVDEVRVLGRRLSAGDWERLLSPLSGAQGFGAGCRVAVYLAGEGEGLESKLFSGTVASRRVRWPNSGGSLEVRCLGLGEVLQRRVFTGDYPQPTPVSTLVDEIVDHAAPELYLEKDTTVSTVSNRFEREGVWGLLEKLAEAATYPDGSSGANFYVDPGGSLRFKPRGCFACPHALSDGSDGGEPNILGLEFHESTQGSPGLVNECLVVVFEEESKPLDGDSLTESAEGWSSPDPTDQGYPLSDTGDRVAGEASIHFNTTNPGPLYRIRLNTGDIDLSQFDELSFYLKTGAGLDVETLGVRIWRRSDWTTDYWYQDLEPGEPATWTPYTVPLQGLQSTGNPGKVVDTVEIRLGNQSQLGVGGVLVDALRFTRLEKAGHAWNQESIQAFGSRLLRVVDKSITDVDYASKLAEAKVREFAWPRATLRVETWGRAQPGYRPPMVVGVTSLQTGHGDSQFQLVRARHTYTPSQGYVCTLTLQAASTPGGGLDPQVEPVPQGLGGVLGQWMRRRNESDLNDLRSRWI